MNGSPPLPPHLSATLAEFRRRVWIVKLAEGVLASLFGLALSYLLVLGLDRVMETPTGLRLLCLLGGMATPGLGLPLKWHRWVWRQRQLEDAARLLRWKFPRLGDQLLGIVELAREESQVTGRSERLVEAAMAQADAAVKGRDLSHAVPRARHRLWGLAAAASLFLIGAGFLLIQDAAANAFERWLRPWRDTDRFTFARVTPLPDPMVVPLAEAFTLPVQLDSQAAWLPNKARGSIPGQSTILAQRDSDNAFSLGFPPQTEDAALAIHVGDVRERVRLQPRPRPELTELTVRLGLPDYLQYTFDPVIPLRGGSVRVLAGAQATFEATTSRSLAEAAMDGTPVQIAGDRLVSAPVTAPLDGDRTVHFTWVDQLGLTPRAPLELQILSVADEAPKLVARRDSLEQVVLDSEVIPFELTASDDFGLRQIGLQWRGVTDTDDATTAAPDRRKISAAGGPEQREIQARATFCATREGVAPQTLEIRAWAEDYLEGRKPSESATFVLHILDKANHALWVTSQMAKWLDAAKETYEREQQLHQSNKELRRLTAAALDRPENRRRVATQAQAETANAERLAGLNRAGGKLVEHATKNPEFDAVRLESWATLLQSLQDIAAQRMPSVADLLKQSADARADAPQDGNASSGERASEKVAASSASMEGGPQIQEGETSPAGGGGPATPELEGLPTPPTIGLTESTLNQPAPADSAAAGTKPPGKGSLGLPTNSLAGSPSPSAGSGEAPASSAQKALDDGVREQRDLLVEFARVSDELSEILASLESSTFVKRLKAASREQTKLASGMRTETLAAFGLPAEASTAVGKAATPPAGMPYRTEHAPRAAEIARGQSAVVKVIQSDLEAYVQRRPDQHFKNVIAEMKETEVVGELKELGDFASGNFNGITIHGAEFWADTLDRWAEEMVKAAACSSCSSCSSDSLPPEIVLKVMQALRDEMALRDETRELENAKPLLEQLYHALRAGKLAKEQSRIQAHTASAIDAIVALPDGTQKFGKALELLTAVVAVMEEATEILNQLETGAPVIAAETEAIELLLQTKRQNPNGGGGGGGAPGGGGSAAAASLAALSELGPGSDGASVVQARGVGQATGQTGRTFPEEFKTGLDAYFNQLETGAPRG